MNIVIQFLPCTRPPSKGLEKYEEALKSDPPREYFKKLKATSPLPVETCVMFSAERGKKHSIDFTVTNNVPMYYAKSNTLLQDVRLDDTDFFTPEDFVKEMQKWDKKGPEW